MNALVIFFGFCGVALGIRWFIKGWAEFKKIVAESKEGEE